MPSRRASWHYTRLFVALLLFLGFGSIVADLGYGLHGLGLLFLIMVTAATVASCRTRASRALAIALAVLSAVAHAVAQVTGHPTAALARDVATALLVAFAQGMIAWNVTHQRELTLDTVLGGVCGYILIAILFMIAYSVLEFERRGSFLLAGRPPEDLGGARRPIGRYPILWYFSLTTLTTVGFGDVLPASGAARALACAEALIGQIYLTTLVAVLVGVYVAGRLESDLRRSGLGRADREPGDDPRPRDEPGPFGTAS